MYQAIAPTASLGISILFVEQNVHAALSIAHRGYVLQNGRVVLGGSATELGESKLVQEAFLARRKGERFGWDLGARALTSLGVAVPTIALGPLAVLFFCIELRVLPMPGDEDAGLLGLLLPSGIVGIALAASLTRQTRAQMLEKLSEPYVTAARARGLSEQRAALRHALRNAAVPVLTLGAAQLGALLSGSVILERLFERPGLGSLLLDAFGARDIPVVQGCALVVAILYVLVNLGSDLLLLVVDPRVRLS